MLPYIAKVPTTVSASCLQKEETHNPTIVLFRYHSQTITSPQVSSTLQFFLVQGKANMIFSTFHYFLAITLSLVLGFSDRGSAFVVPQQSQRSALTSLLATAGEPFEGTVVVCTASNCSKKGGKKALEVFEELAAASEGRLQVETISCVSDCAECAMGPNVELRAKGDSGPFYPIKNKVKTEADVKEILGLS